MTSPGFHNLAKSEQVLGNSHFLSFLRSAVRMQIDHFVIEQQIRDDTKQVGLMAQWLCEFFAAWLAAWLQIID